MASTMSPYSPPVQDDLLVPGCWLSCSSTNYLVQCVLGQGTFGKVAKCLRMDNMRTVAIKVMRKKGCDFQQAKGELSALLNLKLLDSDKCNIVRWYQVFTDKEHICLEFEHLDKSLFDFMEERYFHPIPLKEIRPIVQQLANALGHLKVAGIIHADLKLENVMLVDHAHQPYRVKVIDFGLAHNVSATRVNSYIQSRLYRSPEIILGLPFTEAIDMWSLGCIVAALYLGTLLYPGSSEYDMIRFIVDTQGQPPDDLLTAGNKTCCFFTRDYSSITSLWKLKTPEQFYRETGIQSWETRSFELSSLDDLLPTGVIERDNAADNVAEMIDALMFVEMLKGMLQLDAAKRVTPHQVLEHPFISMRHMVSIYPCSHHVRSCFEIMSMCQETQAYTQDSREAVCGSLQRPFFTVNQPPIKQDHPPPPPPTLHCINPPSNNTTKIRTEIKRKADDEDDNALQASHQAKSINSSSNLDSTNYIWSPPGLKRMVDGGEHGWLQQENSNYYQRSDDNRKRYLGHSTSSTSRTESSISQRNKREVAYDEDSDFGSSHHSKHSSCSSQTWSRLSRNRGDDDDVWYTKREFHHQSESCICDWKAMKQLCYEGSHDHPHHASLTVAWPHM